MRVVIQRVRCSSVTINHSEKRSIGEGLLVLLGIEQTDEPDDVNWLCSKILHLRIFNDDKGVMNLSVQETGGEIMVISQFTLFASTKKGNRPSWIRAAGQDISIPLYESFIKILSERLPEKVVSGEFGAQMDVELINSGPVTIIIDSKSKE